MDSIEEEEARSRYDNTYSRQILSGWSSWWLTNCFRELQEKKVTGEEPTCWDRKKNGDETDIDCGVRLF